MIYSDFSWTREDDGTITITLAPPVSVGGWSVNFDVTKRFGSTDTPKLRKSMSSGFYGTSGMNITSSGTGVLAVTFRSVDTSGWETGLYATRSYRTNSGNQQTLTEGFLLLNY